MTSQTMKSIQTSRPWWQALALAAACLSLTGCLIEEQDNLQTWVKQERANARPRITPLTEPKAFVPQPYTSEEVTEPFERIKLTQALHRETKKSASNMALLAAEQNRRKQELEDYPLDAIVMVGNLDQSKQQTALVRVNKLIYQVKPGAYMGQNYGRIEEITENSIRLREIVQDPAGDWIEKTTVLELQEGSK